MTGLSLRGIARALGGEVSGGQVLAPGPGHSAKDRSLSTRLSARATDGFIVHSHAGDDWQACRDYVRERLGLATANSRRLNPPRRAATDRAAMADAAAKAAGTRQALTLWREAYADGCEARSGISSWMNFYNFRRPHQAMNNQMPMAVWRAGMDKIEAAARAVDMPLRLDNANALPTDPQQNQQAA